jgi:murein DD-endopeptidase MepM/ murein hydrolase activator NlpD
MRFKSYALLTCALLFCGWTTHYLYTYFFDTQVPHIELQGIMSDMHYAGHMPLRISSDKNGYISMHVDQHELVHAVYLKAGQVHQVMVPTEQFNDGAHVVHCTCHDTTYTRNKAVCSVPFVIDNKRLHITLRRTQQEVLQGRTLHVQFEANKPIKDAQVKLLAHTYPCFAANREATIYEAFIPVDCQERPDTYKAAIEVADHVGAQAHLEQEIKVVAGAFKQQRLQVDAEKVAHERTAGRALAELEQALQQLGARSPQEKLWQGAFCTPIDIERVTCEYGTIRTTHDRGRYMHCALDIINAPKSVVWATQRGVVVLKDRFDMSGNTVVLDHGCGLLSLFFHLEDFADIEVGKIVAKGNPLGTLGMTGYATGYHLHWEMRLHNMPVDPMQWTQDIF